MGAGVDFGLPMAAAASEKENACAGVDVARGWRPSRPIPALIGVI